MFCMKCKEPISLLGLLDRKSGNEQYACFNCKTIYLKNSNGLIFLKDENLSEWMSTLEEKV